MDGISSQVDPFTQTFLSLFNREQILFDNKEKEVFERHERTKDANLASKTARGYEISSEEIRLHFKKKKKQEKQQAIAEARREAAKILLQTREQKQDEVLKIRARNAVHNTLFFFRGQIFIQDMLKAVLEAILAYRDLDSSQLVMWTDASGGRHLDDPYGIAAVFKRTPQDRDYTRLLFKKRLPGGINVAELYGIGQALRQAAREIVFRPSLKVVKIFTDSQQALLWCLSFGSNPRDSCSPSTPTRQRVILEAITHLSQRLEGLGVRLELHWVPRHRVEGNIVADRAANYARHCKSGENSQPEWPAPKSAASIRASRDNEGTAGSCDAEKADTNSSPGE